MEKIVAFGEIMLRLTPPDYTTITQARDFIANYGGGEANVLVSLSHFGHNCEFLSKLPDNQLGESAIAHLKSHGVSVDHLVRGSSNIGMYFVETGFGGRPSKVIYNRKHSAVTRIQTNEVDLDEVFKDATWFHISGITLALGENVRRFAFECLEYCKKYNVKVSFDFNYRTKLWTVEEAQPIYKAIIPYVDVLFASYWDINTMIGVEFDDKGMTDLQRRVGIAKKLMSQTNIEYVFGTIRTVHTATDNSLSSYCISKDGSFMTYGPKRFNIYDRIGGGDAFAAGVIHGLIENYSNPEFSLKFGLSTSILKHTLYGDVCTLSVKEVEEYMETDGNAAVQR